MGQVWRNWSGVLVAWVVALPGAVLLAASLTRRRRRRGMPGRTARWRSTAEVGMVVGSGPLVWMTMTPRPGAGWTFFVPLSDLVDQVHTMPPGDIAVQTVGNLLLLAALGFFAPIRFPALAGVGRLLLLGAACSALIEGLQYVLDIGRVTSTDDVWINALGCGVAGLLSRRWWSAGVPRPDRPVPTRATIPR